MTFLWIDLETNGSSVQHEVGGMRERGHSVLEIAGIVTDSRFKELFSFEKVFPIPFGSFQQIEQWPEIVRNMHIDNGLLVECMRLWPANHYEIKQNFDREISLKLGRGFGDNLVLAGSGVSHFDSRLIEREFPSVWSLLKGFDHFTKPTYDIGVVRRFLDNAGKTLPPALSKSQSNHRAMGDLKLFLKQVKWMEKQIKD